MIVAKQVITLEQAQLVRIIRNTVRHYMTQHTTFISSEDQSSWFNLVVKGNDSIHLYLYYDEYDSIVGYGMVNKGYGTLALLEEFRNKGYGTQIYKHLHSLYNPLKIDIYCDNNPSLVSAIKAGFKIVSVDDKCVHLVME